jgi:HNH endonuclease/NUMOD4 motif
MSGEQWRPVVGLDGYEVSDMGRVRSYRAPFGVGTRDAAKTLAIQPTRKGYGRVCVGGRNRFVHRLVLEAFVGPCPVGMQCRHANGDAADNRLLNLSWSTPAENHGDKRVHGTLPVGRRNGAHTRPDRRPTGERNGNHTAPESRPRGQRNPQAKLTDNDVRSIRVERARGAKLAELSARYGVVESVISAVARGRRWSHVEGEWSKAGERE